MRQRIRRLRMPGAKSLLSPLKNLKITDNQLSSDNYFIRKLDMKQSDGSVKLLEDIKEEFEIDEQTDVCLVFECVLVYMATEISGRFLKAAADLFQNLKVISYEQLNLNDRFGAVMLDNLVQRGCGLDGINACLSKKTQMDRFKAAGFNDINCKDMYEIYLALPNRDIIERIEFLDDVEIFQQLLQHYGITTATK